MSENFGTLCKTDRGFSRVQFKDSNGNACSMQTSSALDFHDDQETEDGIPWSYKLYFGIDDAKPQIMVSDAIRLGMDVGGRTNGWMPYPIPDEVHMWTRMHLRRDQVEGIIKRLQGWLDNEEVFVDTNQG